MLTLEPEPSGARSLRQTCVFTSTTSGRDKARGQALFDLQADQHRLADGPGLDGRDPRGKIAAIGTVGVGELLEPTLASAAVTLQRVRGAQQRGEEHLRIHGLDELLDAPARYNATGDSAEPAEDSWTAAAGVATPLVGPFDWA
jgi:hypothetical protein